MLFSAWIWTVKTLAYTSLIRPHLEFASAAWDPYTACDINQLDKVQHHAARFVKNDYRRTTSVSGLVTDLGWQSLEDRRKNSHLALFYKSLHGLSAIPCDSLRRTVRNSRHSDSDTFTILSSRLDCYKFSFFPRTISEWNKLSQDIRSKSSIVSFHSALLKPPRTVKNNFWAMALRQQWTYVHRGILTKEPKNEEEEQLYIYKTEKSRIMQTYVERYNISC